MEQQSASAGVNSDPIKHVVLLMLENHSFDQMLGCFKEVYPDLEGVDPNNLRENIDPQGAVYKQAPTRERQMLLDPRHEVEHVKVQLEGGNKGFVRDFSISYPASTPEKRQFIMGYLARQPKEAGYTPNTPPPSAPINKGFKQALDIPLSSTNTRVRPSVRAFF